jgi:dTMP kinase
MNNNEHECLLGDSKGNEATLVCFEGIDACGKSTQIDMLREHVTKLGFRSEAFSYPNYTTNTGKKILELLKAPERDPLVLQSLMTANRYEEQWQIRKAMADVGDGVVIIDRYWLSGLVYGLVDGLSADWLWNVHNNLIQPDEWIVLDVTVSESFRRRPTRNDAYEASKARMAKARKLYQRAPDWLLNTQCSVIDGMQLAGVVHNEIVGALSE